jgi:hypothetical protein
MFRPRQLSALEVAELANNTKKNKNSIRHLHNLPYTAQKLV